MTAPQDTTPEKAPAQALPPAPAQESHKDDLSSTSHKLQRCWFVTLGLAGGLGFVASQVGLARAEGDFLVDGYSTDGAAPAVDYSASETTFSSLSAPAFEIAPELQSLPEAFPDTFIDAPSAPSVAAEAFTVAPAPAYVPPAPLAASLPAPTTPVAPLPPVTVPVASAPTASAPTASAPTASAPTASAPSASAPVATTPTPSITIEIQPAGTANPQVTQVAPPNFAAARKPVATKTVRRNSLWAGLIEAGVLAGPLSSYANSAQAATVSGAIAASQGVLNQRADGVGILAVANNVANSGDRANSATLVAMAGAPDIADGAALEAAPAAPDMAPPDMAPPDIYPEATAPVVDIEPTAQSVEPIQPTDIVPATLPESANIPEEYNSVFVDPTDYSVGATQVPDVVVSEQSTGCEFTIGAQGVPNGACGTSGGGVEPAPAPLAAPQQGDYAQNAPAADEYYEQAPVASAGPSVSVGPVSFDASGIRFSSSTTAAGREYLNRAVRPMVNLQAAEQFIFPLAIPSPITSLFGFRIHPISGEYRFHAGTDIGAEEGTPVLAAQDGTVLTAEYSGGYGLMVVLEHKVKEAQLQSRYAHLSDMLVEPGKDVKKGDVIGLVGSTGNSTGPHLHFEMLENTADGWVVVNPDNLVQTSLAKLVDALNNPMQAMNFKLSDFNLNLSALRTTAAPQRSESSVTLPSLPGQNGVSFRPAQPNAS
jgi:murein DD-endopeptidase MepM/ murein hydrolase activator NlpD